MTEIECKVMIMMCLHSHFKVGIKKQAQRTNCQLKFAKQLQSAVFCGWRWANATSICRAML